MTMSPYHVGWTAESQVRGDAPSPGDYAWNVNFNNGNANWNNRDNNGFVRAVRAGECQGDVSLRDLHTAWRAARRGKRPSASQLAFESFWIDSLLELQGELSAGTWTPAPPTCFVAKAPKAREIHAPDFRDRVVHHLVVPRLEQIYEPVFIFDLFSNRRGKGTHAAVERLQRFTRQIASGPGSGWYLQLDVHNFFNSIHRPTLYALLKDRMTRHGLPLPLRTAVHALLRRSALDRGVLNACTAAERELVPAHKQLRNAPPGCGIAIGNLSSQFFANVYLNELDQFVKHELRARRYLRYVDDFVLVHERREQLEAWQAAIARFLEERLQLRLKAEIKLRPLVDGIDFLGYIVRPSHLLVRRRVVRHARSRLCEWGRRHVRGRTLRGTPADFREVQAIWTSYAGHFAHAASARLHARLHEEFPWLRRALLRRKFSYRLEGERLVVRGGRR
jgi:hypothetical protein